MPKLHLSRRRPIVFMRRFLEHQASGGLILMAVAALALIVANSAAAPTYFGVLHMQYGGLDIHHWINDGLMALFFLLVGLEIKRELVTGELSTWAQRALPGFAALGGMVVPALFYLALNMGEGGATQGWAIPAATDIAFALGVLSLMGSRVPVSLKIFLTALAILDDLGAVVIIALFYTAQVNIVALGAAAAACAVLAALNLLGARRLDIYVVVGILLWVALLKSGIHATLAGVLLAIAIPLHRRDDEHEAPLERLEHGLHPWVTFLVLPVFGFANAGLSFEGMSWARLQEAVPLGILAGLFLGKQIGVFGLSALAIRLRLAELPPGAGWMQLYGVALLCGIGFTMSLFIGLLAFAGAPELADAAKLGVLLGSVLSALAGAAVLGLARGKVTPSVSPPR